MTRFALALMAAGAAVLGTLPAAHAADLIVNRPSGPGFVDVGSSRGGGWDGAYIGGFAGFAWDSFDDGVADPIDGNGWLLGLAAGANFTVTDGIVAGLVGDVAWTNVEGERTAPSTTSNLDWAGSLRGRLGWDAGPILPYVTGGLAFAGGTLADAGPDDSAIHIGWTAGAGVEMAVTDQLSVDLLYRYSDYGAEQYTIGAGPTTSDYKLTANQVSVGLNWKF